KEIEKKLRSLRAQYTREKKKTKNRPTGTGVTDVYESKWVFFKRLQFLDIYITPKATQSNLK
uniref:MADF domain-containing protein n=1 Tax=Amphimedon queenslandica TaxID=400682 RepID=A0A1X7U9B6_AMPQE